MIPWAEECFEPHEEEKGSWELKCGLMKWYTATNDLKILASYFLKRR